MGRIAYGLVLSAAALLIGPTALSAQWGNWELNVHAGVYQRDLGLDIDEFDLDDENDDTDTDPLVGARLLYNTSSGLSFGGNFDWVFVDQVPNPPGSENEDMNVNLYLYSGEVHYTFPSQSGVKFFLGAGVGGATRRFTDIPPSGGDADFTDLLVPVVVGLKFVNDAFDPSWGFTVEGRDNIIWIDEFDVVELDEDKKAENTFALQGGLSLFFGGGPRYEEVEEEFVQVMDSDGDGVPDDQDRCPNTPAGVQVDSNGCPIQVVTACVDGRDWYRADAPITVEGRSWVKFGTPTTVSPEDLVQIGEFDDVPVFVRTDARVPYREVYLPLCAPANTYQRYRPQQEIRGTTG